MYSSNRTSPIDSASGEAGPVEADEALKAKIQDIAKADNSRWVPWFPWIFRWENLWIFWKTYGKLWKFNENPWKLWIFVGDLVETYGKIHEHPHRSVENPRLYLMLTFGENPIWRTPKYFLIEFLIWWDLADLAWWIELQFHLDASFLGFAIYESDHGGFVWHPWWTSFIDYEKIWSTIISKLWWPIMSSHNFTHTHNVTHTHRQSHR